MPEQEGTVAEGTVAEEIAAEKGQEAQVAISKEEHNRVLAEVSEWKRKAQDSDRTVTRLAKERDEVRGTLDDVMSRKLDLIAKAQAGRLDETKGSLDEQITSLDNTYKQTRAQLEYGRHVEEVGQEIRDILADAGLKIDGDDMSPEVKTIRDKWAETAKTGKPLDRLIVEATKIAREKTKSSVPDVEKLRAQIREEEKKKLHEEIKATAKVDVGTPSGTSATKYEVAGKYARGEISEAEYKKHWPT